MRTAVFILFVLFIVAGDSLAAPLTIEGYKAMADVPEAMALLLIGILIGMIGTFIGAGGGFIIVPLLLILYGFTPQQAIGTSMAVVFLNALSGTFSYMVQKRIDYEIGIKFSVAAVPGVFIGALISQLFGLVGFSLIFGALLAVISYSLFSGKELFVVRLNAIEQPVRRFLSDATGRTYTYSPDMPIGLAVSFFAGVLSGLFGIGGGIIHVPLMYSVLGVPVHVATATSHFILAVTSFFGVITFIGLRSIDIDYAVFLGAGSIFGAYMGAKVSLRTHPLVIKKAISLCLFLLAARLIAAVL
ncbi:MAG: sulfite exporter TauE/SafE family protein [Nitrospirae bacterium]|nr:sulfite exporter TauE/SafE family protein [Nitrospirota bacterium]MCL5978447.1 sulfite exporter TauE/SafE family protein [Nitrospirota bacterium]